MDKDKIITECLKFTARIMNSFDHSDPGHQMGHIYAVLGHINNAIKCNKTFVLSETEELAMILATIMHDLDDHKLSDTHENLDNARYVLNQLKLSEPISDLVLQMIKLVSCSSNGNNNNMCHENKNWWILWPRICDRIEAIGKIGVWRAWIYAINKGNPMHTSDTPLPKTEEELNEILSPERFSDYSGKSNSFIDHFYDKLLYIANIDSPEVQSNEYLLSIAKKRHQVMINFVLDYSNSENKDKVIKNYIP